MKTKSRIITLQQLRDVRACDGQVAIFKQHFDACAPALKVRDDTRAVAFANAYINEGA